MSARIIATLTFVLVALPFTAGARLGERQRAQAPRPLQRRLGQTPVRALRPTVLALRQQNNVPLAGHDPLAPRGVAVSLTASLKKFVKGTERLASSALAHFAKVVPLADNADLFTAKTLVNVQEMVEGLAGSLAQSQPQVAAALKTILAPKVGSSVLLRLPAHQFNVGGKLGNRIVLYGNEAQGGPGHGEIDKLAHALDSKGISLVKVMTHFDEAQGGLLADIVKGGVSGMTHVGGYAAGFLGGKAVSVRSDWPSNYGILGDANRHYNAHILAVDYQAGAKKTIPKDHLRAYNQNYKVWDVVTGLLVGFTNADQIPDHTDYKHNPLEVHDQQSLNDMAQVWARMDRREVQSKGTFYCAEGRWTTANLAPNVLIQKGRFPKIDALITEFQKAPGVSPQHPERGWAHLLQKNLITQAEHDGLVKTNRTAVYLDWVPNTVQPWTAYSPRQKDGLIADPMTLAGLVRGLLRAHFPREKVATTVAGELAKAHAQGGATAQTVEGLLGGHAPSTPQGQLALAGLGMKMASGTLAATLQNPQFKDMMLKKLGYQHIVNPADKTTVDGIYDEFVKALQDPSLDTREKLDARLTQIDQKLSGMKVEMYVHDPVTLQRTSKRMVSFWHWAPPQAWVWWAQNPELWNSRAVRYVATAMHADQAAGGAGH